METYKESSTALGHLALIDYVRKPSTVAHKHSNWKLQMKRPSQWFNGSLNAPKNLLKYKSSILEWFRWTRIRFGLKWTGSRVGFFNCIRTLIHWKKRVITSFILLKFLVAFKDPFFSLCSRSKNRKIVNCLFLKWHYNIHKTYIICNWFSGSIFIPHFVDHHNDFVCYGPLLLSDYKCSMNSHLVTNIHPLI